MHAGPCAWNIQPSPHLLKFSLPFKIQSIFQAPKLYVTGPMDWPQWELNYDLLSFFKQFILWLAYSHQQQQPAPSDPGAQSWTHLHLFFTRSHTSPAVRSCCFCLCNATATCLLLFVLFALTSVQTLITFYQSVPRVHTCLLLALSPFHCIPSKLQKAQIFLLPPVHKSIIPPRWFKDKVHTPPLTLVYFSFFPLRL